MAYVADRSLVVVAWSWYCWRVVIESQATIESDAENSHRVCHGQVDISDWYWRQRWHRSQVWPICDLICDVTSFCVSIYYHGLCDSTSCCISHGPSQWEREIFDPPQLGDTSTDFMKLEIDNYLTDSTPHAKFQGATSTLMVWGNSQFDAWKFLSFFRFFVTPSGCIFRHIPTHYTSLNVVPAKEVHSGG